MKMRLTTKETGLCLLGVLAGSLGGYVSGTHGYAVDWASTGTMIQGWAALLAAVVAAWGVNRWQQELRYKRNSELAVKALTAAAGVEASLKAARRAAWEWEIDPAHPGRRVLQLFSYEARLKALKEPDHSSELAGLSNQVAAIFGADHRDAITSLVMTHTIVVGGLEQSIALRNRADAPDPMDNVYDYIEVLSPTIFPQVDGGDHFGDGIADEADRIRELFQKSM
jgi:hypothetical protein